MKLNLLQKKVVAFILLIACINLFMGCHRYFRPVRIEASNTENKQLTLKKLSGEERYFILRRGGYNYALSNITINPGKMTLTANVGEVPPEHQLYLKQTRIPPYKYSKAKKQDIVLTEVHLYTGDTTRINSSMVYTLSFSDIHKIELIEIDKRKTTNSYVWGAIGITLGVALVVVIIAALSYTPPQTTTTTNSSCPFISTFDGKDYKLQGEIYSAAIYPSLQKDDYLPLQIEPVAGDYRIKISNELEEIQHTDFAELMVVEHDKNVKILMDPGGNIYSISQPQLPIRAMLNNRIDVSDELMYKDNKSCIFKDDTGTRAAEDLYITFKNDLKSTKGKLVLRAKTSFWLSYLYTEFTKGFGSYYEKWAKEQEMKPANELEKWTEEQNIPLTISVKTMNGWKEIKKIKTIGPLACRDMAIPVELSDGEPAEFKISGGYMFWELDYAAIDYSPNADFTVQTIKPYEAINEHGANELPNLLNADKKYLVQPNIGDSTILKYKAVPGKEGMAQTFFLYTSGYYKHIRDYKGTPKVAFVKSFSQPGVFRPSAGRSSLLYGITQQPLKINSMFKDVKITDRVSLNGKPNYTSTPFETIDIKKNAHYNMQILKGWQAKWVDTRVGFHILKLATINYGSLIKSIRVLKSLYLFKKSILGGMQTKIVKVNGKYYHHLYAPGYPSKAFDNYIEGELHRILPIKKKANVLTFIFFAVTKKCPLQCEHCFEWNNLNKSESLNLAELKAVISKFQKDGIAQFHLSGGEPMVRIKDLIPVITGGEKQTEFYVLTSGFNFTPANAKSLKDAGLTGVVISLDHFDPQLHDVFRGFSNSFDQVMNAVHNAQEQNLVIALTICVTRSFTTWDNLMQYAELAKKLKVPFIQLLEPKAIGHYEGKDVYLDESHFSLLDKFFLALNFDHAYNNYPLIIYHGYHQRRIGCLSGGNRTLYIDSAGYVNACPFCQTKNFNIKDAIKADLNVAAAVKATGCQEYENAV